jgi:hypothetical protein
MLFTSSRLGIVAGRLFLTLGLPLLLTEGEALARALEASLSLYLYAALG